MQFHSPLIYIRGNHIKAGAEFATPAITSPGFEQIFDSDPQTIAGFEQGVALLIDEVQYLDASRKGYVMGYFYAKRSQSRFSICKYNYDQNYCNC